MELRILKKYPGPLEQSFVGAILGDDGDYLGSAVYDGRGGPITTTFECPKHEKFTRAWLAKEIDVGSDVAADPVQVWLRQQAGLGR